MHILIAPNAFKNSLTAATAAQAIEKGLQSSPLECTTQCFPIADGGDGTASLIIQQLQGAVVQTRVHDPLGRLITASFGLIENDGTAVIEMADASGLRLLKQDELNPLRATSFGTGELIKAALDKGVNQILIAMGGSATVDGGTGILKALGTRFLDVEGYELINLPENLVDLHEVDISQMDTRLSNCEIVVLCDVDNKLLGEKGAAAVFGPQKGADADGVKKLDAALTRLAEVTLKITGKDMTAVKYGGAAGGASSGVYAYLNARLVNGIEHFLTLTSFDVALEQSGLVITGEGSIDEQTLQGKGPFGVASRAKLKNLPVIALAGKVPQQENEQLSKYFDVLIAIGNEPTDIKSAIKNTEQNLVRTAREIAKLLKLG
ncbi:glycerate kinase family protein [Mucilaginibacter aquaedulcis]|uniref:glycerate kinase family protein n=1 Tax=Mucilaginibacter aquaedulcis TaxID=1187081 RepID=UPI0025B57034|nr:glycerate kinase [Mucilaginibacter aquaedulcis]MDN3548576.1 glycerate kinase [Mucilaginibacter aquaedulcis]